MEFKERPHEPFFSTQTFGKILVFSLLVVGAAVLQTSFFGAAGFFPAAPDLLLSVIVGIAIYDGERSAAVAGIGAGFLCEALGGAGTALMPVFYLLTGYTVGIFSRIFLRKNFLSWIVVIIAAASVKTVIGLVYLLATEKHFNFIVALIHQLAPEFLMTVLFSLPILLLSRACARPFHKQIELD